MNEKEERLRKIVREEATKVVGEALSEAILPKGHIRCEKCGEIKKEGDVCLYCKRAEQEAQKPVATSPEEKDLVDEVIDDIDNEKPEEREEE